jgi:hypothetical protein
MPPQSTLDIWIRRTDMDLWTMAHHDLHAIDTEEVATSVDQRLKVAEIKALLAIGQLLATIQGGRPNG